MAHTPDDMVAIYRRIAVALRSLKTFPTAWDYAAEFDRMADEIAALTTRHEMKAKAA